MKTTQKLFASQLQNPLHFFLLKNKFKIHTFCAFRRNDKKCNIKNEYYKFTGNLFQQQEQNALIN